MNDEKLKAKQKAMKLLQYRDRTVKELEEKLVDAGFSKESIHTALEYVISFGYLDDERYATHYVNINKGVKSRLKIKMELKNKGVDQEIIERVMEDVDETAALQTALMKKIKNQNIHDLEYEEKMKLAAHLARKGFRTDKIKKLLF